MGFQYSSCGETFGALATNKRKLIFGQVIQGMGVQRCFASKHFVAGFTTVEKHIVKYNNVYKNTYSPTFVGPKPKSRISMLYMCRFASLALYQRYRVTIILLRLIVLFIDLI